MRVVETRGENHQDQWQRQMHGSVVGLTGDLWVTWTGSRQCQWRDMGCKLGHAEQRVRAQEWQLLTMTNLRESPTVLARQASWISQLQLARQAS